MYYEKELKALHHSKRFRVRTLNEDNLVDLASNDYLSLAHNRELLSLTCKEMEQYDFHAPKASMLVNGYHVIHHNFEEALCDINGFEAGVVVGSGFNANIAMIEALCRKKDTLFIDEKYHASGMVATKMLESKVVIFAHNDMNDLRHKLALSSSRRNIIAVEGIYSMDGDIVDKEIFSIADEFDAILIVDEAHSSGIVGKKLMGVFDLYEIIIKPNYIKMGTLGKAYGSFGGYILSSEHINTYLINRAKPIIYATAPSLFDTLLAHKALEYIIDNSVVLQQEIADKQKIIAETLGLHVRGLIVPILIDDNAKVMQIQAQLKEQGILVGAIRQPTVEKAIIRLIARVGVENEYLHRALKIIKKSV